MANDLTITVKISGLAGMESDLKKAKEKVQQFGDQISSLLRNQYHQIGVGGVALGTFLGTSIANAAKSIVSGIVDTVKSVVNQAMNFVSDSVNKAADFEQVAIAFDVMLGGADKAKSLLSDLQRFAQATPFQLSELTQTSKLLVGMGVAQEDIINTMKTLGDVSAGVGIDINRLGLVFGQIKSRTRLYGDDLKQLEVSGIGMSEMLSKGLGVSVARVREMISEGAIDFDTFNGALTSATRSGGRFENMMQRQMNTFRGVQSNLQDIVDKFMLTVGGIDQTEEHFGELIEGGLLANLRDQFKNLLKVLDDNKAKIAEIGAGLSKLFGQFVNEILPKIINELPGILERLPGIITGIVEGIKQIGVEGSKVKKTFDDIGNVFRTIGDIFQLLYLEITLKLQAISSSINIAITTIEIMILQIEKAFNAVANRQAEVNRLNAQIAQKYDEITLQMTDLAVAGGKLVDKIAETRGQTTTVAQSFLDIQSKINAAKNSADGFAGSLANASFQANKITIPASFSMKGFQSGGIVGGDSSVGDRNFIRANSGEMVLTKGDQFNLLQLIRSSRPNQTINANFNTGNRSDRQEMNMFTSLLKNI